jgi:hypothetical protein
MIFTDLLAGEALFLDANKKGGRKGGSGVVANRTTPDPFPFPLISKLCLTVIKARPAMKL